MWIIWGTSFLLLLLPCSYSIEKQFLVSVLGKSHKMQLLPPGFTGFYPKPRVGAPLSAQFQLLSLYV